MKLRNKRFRTLFIWAFMATVTFSFWIAVHLLYTSITKSYEIEFLNKIKANQAEINLLLKERSLLIEQRVIELSRTNAVLVNMMLGVQNQIEETVRKHAPLLAGTFFTVFDIETGLFYPPLPAGFNLISEEIKNSSDENKAFRNVMEDPHHIEIFSHPIKHKGKILGYAYGIYRISEDAPFWERFNQSLSGDIYYAAPAGIFSLNPANRTFDLAFSYATLNFYLGDQGFSCFEGYCAAKLADHLNRFFITSSTEISDRKKQLLIKLWSLGIILTALAFAVGCAVANIISRPIKHLSEQAYQISKLDTNRDLRTNDLFYELSVLCQAFNTVLNKFRSSEKLEEQAKLFLDSIINTVPDPILVKNKRFEIVLANEAFCNLFGCDRKKIVGKKASYFLDPEESECFEAQDQGVLQSGQTNIREVLITDRQDRQRLISSKKVLLNDPDNGQPLIVAVIRDITEEKALEKELIHHKESLLEIVRERTEELIKTNEALRKEINEKEKAQQAFKETERQLARAQRMEAIGTLAGGVAHDLNNILAGVLSYPDFLLYGLDKDNPLRAPIQTIKKSGEKAAAIVQDLLTLARRNIPLFEPLDLNHIIREYLISPEFRYLKGNHPDVIFEFSPQGDLKRISGSPVHLSKAAMNLVTNAAEAICKQGNVWIGTSNVYLKAKHTAYDQTIQGEYVLFSIKDNGSGIKSEDKEKIFEPFFTNKVLGRSGTGLGMAVVWGIVKDHGASIDMESTVGTGTTFKIYFPVTGKLPEKAAQEHREDSRGSGESILIIDDDEDQRNITGLMLSHLGYNSRSVCSGEDAIALMKSNDRFDLILLDMIMPPGIDGFDTYKQILEIQKDQKAIIASGYSETERVKKTLALGAGAYLKKPYTLDKLARIIKKELSRP